VLIDEARIMVRSGDGGNGSASFLREKYMPRGGPDGGDGGRGGDLRLRVKENVSSLLPFKYTHHFRAEHGTAGGKRNRHGKSGEPFYVDVPPGTVVWNDATGELLADLTEPDEEVTLLRGGRGGLGNTHFKSSTRQAPRIAELGEPGEEMMLRLELRIIADVGLVGLPNAGKSTLLAAASRARPKIADYPFTTLEPHLGVVEIGGKGGEVYVLADIPGLIEGAAAGAGLGHEFLRHVRRTKALVHVLDTSGGLEGRDPLADFLTIVAELGAFDAELAAKPMLVALNKVDLAEARENVPELRAELIRLGHQVHEISAVTGQGVSDLLNAIGALLRELALQEKEVAEKPQERRRYTMANVDERAWDVQRTGSVGFVVTGIGIERFTRMTNFALDHAVERFQRLLETSGVEAELRRQGVKPGDVVHIANHELIWGTQDEAGEIIDLELDQEQELDLDADVDDCALLDDDTELDERSAG
jgi:GTP-binding protein